MRTQEWVELALIAALVIAVYLFATTLLGAQLTIGRLTLYLSALLLGQSLVRDLYLITQKSEAHGEPAAAQCMCIESTVGGLGIVVGALLMLLLTDGLVTLSPGAWTAAVLVTLLVGFFIKDYVFGWNPWRIEKDRDHINIIFKW